jgi:FixJ family two-component response regulator
MSDSALIHIVDDDASVRAGLESLLHSVGMEVRGHASADAFLAADRPDVAGCLVLDVRLPGIGGLEFQTRLAEFGIAIPIVMITGFGDVPMSVRAMKAGAVDFLPKPFRDQDFLEAVTLAIGRDRTRRAEEARLAALQRRYDTLTPRERQVMALVAAGRMNKQVAGDLSLSEITVKIHRGAAMRKMKARTLPDLVRMTEALGLGS